MSPEEAGGFFAFLEEAGRRREQLTALKGQITGPITFCTGLVDQDGRAVFYNDQLRDAAVKLLAMKARWQTRMMAQVKERPLIFFDEPGLAGFGSSAFITITPADIAGCFSEVFAGVHQEGGLAGVHVCANTEWSVIFDTAVDIVNFDAYSYFDKLRLYPQQLTAFFARGGILASGIVPTAAEQIRDESAASLADKWFEQTRQLGRLGIDERTVFAQTLITPSCGTGAISEELAETVLRLTGEVSALIRTELG
jgi:methionine synthase II (cobalamin-independent)